MKKEKVKTVEEVIDVVGDFGPTPVKQDESSRYASDEENFGQAFDSVQNESQTQDQQSMMLPPVGEFLILHNLLTEI